MSGRAVEAVDTCEWTRSAPDTITAACGHSMSGWITLAGWLAHEESWAGRLCEFCKQPIRASIPKERT